MLLFNLVHVLQVLFAQLSGWSELLLVCGVCT